jgi:hypothetical protein
VEWLCSVHVCIDTLNKSVDEREIDVTKHVLDFRVFSSDGALQDADTLGILVENGLDVLRLPKRVGKRGEAPLRSTVTLDVCYDRIALAIILLEVH